MIKPTEDIFNTGTERFEINENNFIDPQIETVENIFKKQPKKIFSELFFLYDKSNIVKKSFLTELNKFLSLFGSISFSGSVKKNLLPTVSSEKPTNFFFDADKLKESLELQLTKIDRTFPQTKDKKMHELCIVQTGKKRKMQGPLDSLFVRDQQDFDLYEQLNPIEIKITDDTVINKLNKYKQIKSRFTMLGLLFPANIQNDTNQIFLTCRELNKAKTGLINGKILSILGMINLDKINEYNKIKGKSVWINANFEDIKDKNSEYISFSFETKNLSDSLSFSLYLVDSQNNKITFSSGEKTLALLILN